MKKNCLVILLILIFHITNAQKLINFQRIFKTSNPPIYVQNVQLKSSSNYQKLDSTINFTLTGKDSLYAFLKETFEYDEYGNMIRNIDYKRNLDDVSWQNDFKWEHRYNSSNKWTSVIITNWDTAKKQWVNHYRENFEYDDLDNKTQSEYFKPDSTFNKWINDYRETFSYDSNSNLKEHLYFQWAADSEKWVNDYKIIYQYDAAGNRIKADFFKPDSLSDNWIKDYKSIFTHNDDNLLVSTFHARWDTIRNLWSTDYLADYSYDSLGNRVQNIYSRWNKAGKWLGEFKENYAYNDSNLPTDLYLYSWNASKNQWDPLNRKDFSYPFDVEKNHLVLPRFFYEEEGKTDINSMASSLTFVWDTLNSTWINTKKRVLYFSDFEGIINAVKSNELISVNVYQNPVSDVLYIDFTEHYSNPDLELYNAVGNLVYKKSNVQKITVTNFPKGLYILRISERGKNAVVRKIIIN